MMAGHSRSPWAALPLLLLITLASLQLSSAALNAYAYVKGTKQGQIKGSVTQKGREDAIMVNTQPLVVLLVTCRALALCFVARCYAVHARIS